jgi:hypothetical protein
MKRLSRVGGGPIRPAAGAAVVAALILAAGFAIPAHAAAGWQKPFTFDVPKATKQFSFHYPCPDTEPVAVTGGYASNSIGQPVPVHLTINGPRLDETPPDFSDWEWHLVYVGTGAPEGTKVTFDVYCVAR